MQFAVARKISHFVSLRLSGKRADEMLTYDVAILFVNHVQQVSADEILAPAAQPLEGRAVAPLE